MSKKYSVRSYIAGKTVARAFLILALFSVFLNTSAAEDKVLVLGGKSGWDLVSKSSRIVSGKGKFGYDAMVLDTNSKKSDDVTDLLVSFEGGNVVDSSGHYDVPVNEILTTDKAFMGKGSGSVRGAGGASFRGNSSSVFGKKGATGSFTIEFWLCPSIAENGEVVFSWRSSRTVSNYPLYQMISASFFNNHFQWTFMNVFNGYVQDGGEITLQSYRTIIPDTWMHHSISYDEDSGLLEYRINGLLENLKYVTSNGHENGGSVYIPLLGVPADIDLCPRYTGLIDEFRISRCVVREKDILALKSRYPVEGGRFETEPILLSKGASLKRIDASVTVPSQTNAEFFVRSGDNFYDWTDSYPEWIPVKNHADMKNVTGLYFQIAANLFPDGSGTKTPAVNEIKLVYEEIPSPLPPFTLFASTGNGEVTLSWPYSVDDSVGGYYIFYGERSGEYMGVEALEGPSPVEAGNVTSMTLSGLKNGKIYYFSVAAYSKYDGSIIGKLSKEVFARPQKQ